MGFSNIFHGHHPAIEVSRYPHDFRESPNIVVVAWATQRCLGQVDVYQENGRDVERSAWELPAG